MVVLEYVEIEGAKHPGNRSLKFYINGRIEYVEEERTLCLCNRRVKYYINCKSEYVEEGVTSCPALGGLNFI